MLFFFESLHFLDCFFFGHFLGPFEIFVRELVAIDGGDSSEIVLIDSIGCPTDANIMNSLTKIDENEKSLHAPFNAFKFPTSDVVQFRALVTPCLSKCEPIQCDIKDYDGMPKQALSYGRRKRRSEDSLSLASDKEMVVVQTIKILDSFVGTTKGQREDVNSDRSSEHMTSQVFDDKSGVIRQSNSCASFLGLVFVCSLFLIAQLFLMLIWVFFWNKKQSDDNLKIRF